MSPEPERISENAPHNSVLRAKRQEGESSPTRSAFAIKSDKRQGLSLSEYVAFGTNLEHMIAHVEGAGDRNDYITARDSGGRTALHFAAMGSSFDIACWLIEEVRDKAAYVMMQDSQGYSALLYAATHKESLPLIKELIRQLNPDDSPADDMHDRVREYVSHKAANGDTALHLSASCGSGRTTLYLLEIGASPKAKSNDGSTAWDKSTRYENWAAMAAFISQGPLWHWHGISFPNLSMLYHRNVS